MDHTAALLSENHLFSALVRGADPAVPVPTCAPWTIRKLAAHVARGDRWAATIVATRSQVAVAHRDVWSEQPDDRDAEQAWVEGGAAELVEAVAVDPEVPVWTFVGPKPASWWVRRRLHEATVHRADAALALGVPYEIAPELAADGLSEYVDLVAARPAPGPLDPGVTLHLHATDDGLGAAGEWVLRGTEGGVTWEHGHEKCDVAVRGTAADLLLATFRRKPDGVEVLGDTAVWQSWLARTSF